MSDLPPPGQPYRAAALFHAALAAAIVLVSLATGGDLPKALAIAVGYFAVATAWTWFRYRQRASRGAPSTTEPTGSDET